MNKCFRFFFPFFFFNFLSYYGNSLKYCTIVLSFKLYWKSFFILSFESFREHFVKDLLIFLYILGISTSFIFFFVNLSFKSTIKSCYTFSYVQQLTCIFILLFFLVQLTNTRIDFNRNGKLNKNMFYYICILFIHRRMLLFSYRVSFPPPPP